MFCVPTSPFKFKSIITSGPSPVFTEQLYALYKLALCVKLTTLNLIFNYLGFKLTVAVYRGLFTGRPLFCVPCVFYILIQSGNITQHYFWPIKT